MELELCERLVTMDRRRTARRVSDTASKLHAIIVDLKNVIEADHLTRLQSVMRELNEICDELILAGESVR